MASNVIVRIVTLSREGHYPRFALHVFSVQWWTLGFFIVMCRQQRAVA